MFDAGRRLADDANPVVRPFRALGRDPGVQTLARQIGLALLRAAILRPVAGYRIEGSVQHIGGDRMRIRAFLVHHDSDVIVRAMALDHVMPAALAPGALADTIARRLVLSASG